MERNGSAAVPQGVSEEQQTVTRQIEAAIAGGARETARRLCQRARARFGDDSTIRKLQHAVARAQGDLEQCRLSLKGFTAPTAPEQRQVIELQIADLKLASGEGFYRTSRDAAMGLTFDEYQARLASEIEQLRAQAAELAAEPDASSPPIAPSAQDIRPAQSRIAAGSIKGILRYDNGEPADGVKMTLGLPVDLQLADPSNYLSHEMHYQPKIGDVRGIDLTTDAGGAFTFAELPQGRYPFLAVRLPDDQQDITTHFIAHDVEVKAGEATVLDAAIRDWVSAAPKSTDTGFPEQIIHGGVRYRRTWQHFFRNPFHFDFPRQALTLPLSDGGDAGTLLALDSRQSDTPLPLQVVDGEALVFTNLPALGEFCLALFAADASPATAASESSMFGQIDDRSAVIDTGRAQFQLAWDQRGDRAPLLAVRGEDRRWRGKGRLVLPVGVTVVGRRNEIIDNGPLLLRVRQTYELSTGDRYVVTLVAHRGEPYLLVTEESADVEGARFEFSLSEFSGGRGYLHWKGDPAGQNWSSLAKQNRELARLQESVPWWIPPAGFGYAMTKDGLDEADLVGVFTVRRGDWIDRKFEAISRGPGDDAPWKRELDWPYPEMVGSTISMITAHTDSEGDAFFRFPMFDGRRHWGILVSTLERNDGPYKEISSIQHKNSSPTLQQFMTWHLDEADATPRPHVVAERTALRRLRQKRTDPAFSKYWQLIKQDRTGHTSSESLCALVEGDPLQLWRRKLQLVGVAHIRSRMTLLGRDYSDMYSPVGARPLTHWAEEYDLLAATGVFTADEERLVRAFLILMGHLYMTPDLMNWQFGSRNANFEADRVDVVGTIGIVFRGHSDSQKFIDHALELMERSLAVYCTPGSGKWYENPACYYLQASKCRMNLLFHLSTAGLFDPTTLPRLKEFLRWGILLLTPPQPRSYETLRDGCDDAAYRASEKARRIAPIGDHAQLGPRPPEHYALASTLFRKTDPQFADELLWTYLSGGSDGTYFGNVPLLFGRLESEDLRLGSKPAPLHSRRLEGFGAIFRSNFASEDESYLLFKQGPGGYRYHRSEGSILFFADGKPLIYDGGEAGETWRHTTLSFYNTHMPLSAGHVERFFSSDAIDFCQGVHPLALQPGMPVFLSDTCEHTLVDEAYRRYQHPKPADSRTVLWVKDQYVILHDELDIDPSIPSFWHLQAVADDCTAHAGNDYRFRGRFGTDLQVVLPGQTFAESSVEALPMLEYRRTPQETFAMQHLQLRAEAPQHYLAILRPLSVGQSPITAAAIYGTNRKAVGVRVRGGNCDHIHYFSRDGLQVDQHGAQLIGRYASVLRRADRTVLCLIDGDVLVADDMRIESRGLAVVVTRHGSTAGVVAEGRGRCRVSAFGNTLDLESDGPRVERTIVR